MSYFSMQNVNLTVKICCHCKHYFPKFDLHPESISIVKLVVIVFPERFVIL
jgi:hypothetical protein